MAEPMAPNSVFERLLKDRIIWLGSEVRDENANEICAKILLLAAEDPEADIYLYINSPGGSITAGMAIYDTMSFVPNDIVTVGIGMAASMGQFLLTAGTKGKRYITPNARVLLHQPHGGFGGTASDMPIEVGGAGFIPGFTEQMEGLAPGESRDIDVLLLLLLPYFPGCSPDLGAMLSQVALRHNKPMVAYVPRLDKYRMLIEGFEIYGVPVAHSIEGAVHMAAALKRYGQINGACR